MPQGCVHYCSDPDQLGMREWLRWSFSPVSTSVGKMPQGSKPQILIVDDEPDIRENLGILLMSAGYDVVAAEDGVSAVSHLTRTVPNLILTDLNMPQMSGVELISHVRTRY